MNNLPIDIHEIIYKRLGPKERVCFRLAVSKTSAKIYKPTIEKKLAVVYNYINKNKTRINNNEIPVSTYIHSFIINNQDDYYIKNLGHEINICVEEKNDDINLNQLLSDITNNKVIDILKYDFTNLKSYKLETLIIDKISEYANSKTFEELYKHQDIQNIFKTKTLVNDFCFGLINHSNIQLLEYIFNNTEQDQQTFDWIIIGKTYMNRIGICTIFTSNCCKIKLLLKYFDLSLESKRAILEEAEKCLSEETALFIQKYI
jgi:hypothetical protein